MREIFSWLYAFGALVLIAVALWFGLQLFLIIAFLFFAFLVLVRIRHWFMTKGSRAYRQRNNKQYGEKVEQIKD